MQQYTIVFIWGLLTVLAFVGWGRLAGRLAGNGQDDTTDWGLRAGWGMALALFIGGVAASLGMATRSFAISFVLVGIIVHFFTWARPRITRDILRDRRFLALCAVSAIVLIRYAAWVHNVQRDCNDDDVAYFTFIYRLLDTGSLIEPFSIRRIVSFGGQSFLQSLIVAMGDENNGLLMDRGVSNVISFGLILGLFRSRDAVVYSFALIMAVIVPFPVLNSASHLTGLVMFLTLYRTLLITPDPAKAGFRRLALIALIMAGAGSLRTHFIFVVAVIGIAYWLFCYFNQRHPFRLYLVSLFKIGFVSSAFLAPWMIHMYASSGTGLFPIFHGNSRPEQDFFNASVTAMEHLETSLTFLTTPEMIFFLPLLLFWRLKKHALVLCFYGGAVIGVIALLWMFSSADIPSIGRYMHPIIATAFYVSFAALLQDLRQELAAEGTSRPLGDMVIIVVAVLLAPFIALKDMGRTYNNWGQYVIKPELRAAYARMQDTIPKGAGVLAVLDQPFALQYARNEIFNIDFPGSASPDPGMPFFKGAQALKEYLVSQSIDYVVFKDFERTVGCEFSIYSRKMWEYHKTGPLQTWRLQAAYYFDIMDNVLALAAEGKVLYDDNGLKAFKMR